MKRKIAALIACIVGFSMLVGCSVEKTEIAVIVDVAQISENAFTQSVWEGAIKYAEEKSISAKAYSVEGDTQESYLETMATAIKAGAQIVVASSNSFETLVYEAQTLYPDVSFVLIDGVPQNETGSVVNIASNTVSVSYAEEQAGFLAGYAMVKEGYTSLGFIGGTENDPVIRFGYGFVQGAEYAAQELLMNASSITINYTYTGSFEATDAAQAKATQWYENGTQVIFACGGGLCDSVIAAAEETGAKVVGVDVDQSSLSKSIVTSAMKGVAASVYDAVASYYDGTFQGGQALLFDASSNGVALAIETAKLSNFTQDDYDDIFAMLANNTDKIADGILGEEVLAVTDLALSAVVVDPLA